MKITPTSRVPNLVVFVVPISFNEPIRERIGTPPDREDEYRSSGLTTTANPAFAAERPISSLAVVIDTVKHLKCRKRICPAL